MSVKKDVERENVKKEHFILMNYIKENILYMKQTNLCSTVKYTCIGNVDHDNYYNFMMMIIFGLFFFRVCDIIYLCVLK